jgi:hypothetical protein
MNSTGLSAWVWEVASDAQEVHHLLCASDAYIATTKTPAPHRNRSTTENRVRSGSVHLLRHDGEAVAMFTLTWEPPFAEGIASFPLARKAAYLSRLAVCPDWLERSELVGVQCLRKAAELATAAGADALRSEANPDLEKVRTLLALFGFVEYQADRSTDGRRRVYLQKDLCH